MEEVRPVLHAIFRRLLKRLDGEELREAAGVRQGKTCPFIHISVLRDGQGRVLWILQPSSENLAPMHRLSTEGDTPGWIQVPVII
jgi:hypothetical protein